VDKPHKSVTHGQCEARPMVTLLATGHYCRTTDNKLYCFVTKARVCVCVCVNNLPTVLAVEWAEIELVTS